MKVTVPCPITGRPLTCDIKEAKTQAEAKARAIHRLKKAAETFTDGQKAELKAKFQQQQSVLEQVQLTLATKMLHGLKNKQLDLMNLEALTRLMR